jgi:1,2-diacylglycerol 3-beta-galactosyltransferase
VRAALRTQVRTVLADHLAATDPDVVLSVHPLLNHVTAGLLRDGRRPRALMTVVTDLVDIHRGWACRDADLVVVPTAEARLVMLRRRVPASRIRQLGMPVDLRFRPARPGERAALRERLGLDARRPTVLVAGGGEGSGDLLGQVGTLAESSHPWQVMAVCGRNERLRRRLLGRRYATPVLPLGFVDDMPDLMRASDLVIGKAGPGAIAEALATGLPLVLTSYLPGQEHGNVRFVVEARVGRYAPRPDRLLAAVGELLSEDGDAIRANAAHAAVLGRPQCALDIASACLSLVADYSAVSHASR